MKKLILITVLFGLLILMPHSAYLYNKTYGKDTTDCMIQYVTKYYPNGSTYLINGDSHHIDKSGIGNTTMIETSKVQGCIFTDSILSFIYNTPYCYTTLLYEKGIN